MRQASRTVSSSGLKKIKSPEKGVRIKEESCGDGYIDSLAAYIQEQFPCIRGFNRRGLYRMKQFYETYAGNEKVSPLVTQLSWTNHLLIMSGCKSDEEREFYMRLAIKERYGKRQLERRIPSVGCLKCLPPVLKFVRLCA